jgi:hypothetical protein
VLLDPEPFDTNKYNRRKTHPELFLVKEKESPLVCLRSGVEERRGDKLVREDQWRQVDKMIGRKIEVSVRCP